MIGLVVAAHGALAPALLTTAQSVVPGAGPGVAVSIETGDDTACYEARFRRAVALVRKQRAGVLVLTDMFGGTPSNIGMTLHKAGKIEVLTGVNLPMLIKVLQLMGRGESLETTARLAKESGARAIAIASEVLLNVPRRTGKSS